MPHTRSGSPTSATVVLMIGALVACAVVMFAGPSRAEQTEDPVAENADGPGVRFGDTERTERARSDASAELIVVMQKNAIGRRAGDVLGRSLAGKGGEIVEGQDDYIKTVRFPDSRGDGATLREKAAEISDLPGVDYAELNGFSPFAFKPNDTFIQKPSGTSNQGNFALVNLFGAWDVSKGDDVAVGFIDSGIYKYHRDTTPSKVLAEKDVVNRDNEANDTTGHGTSVASLAAAATNNSYGMAGAGFRAKIAACRANEAGVQGFSLANEARCLNWLQKVPKVKVISISAGKDGSYSRIVASEIAETQNRYGKAVVVSSGNYRTSGNPTPYTNKMFPAKLPGVIGVGSNSSATKRSDYSVMGPHVDLMAPGSVIAAYGHNRHGVFTGTSYSAPTVAGCVALMYAEGFKLGAIRQRLFDTARDMNSRGYDTATGHGYMDCGRAIGDR